MKRKYLLFMGIMLAGFFTAQTIPKGSIASARIVEGIVAKVNNEIILESEFNEQWKLFQAQAGKEAIGREGELKRHLLQQMIEEKIILQKAKEEDIEVSKEEINIALQNLKDKFPDEESFAREMSRQGLGIEQLKQNLKNQLMIARLIDKYVRAKIQVTNKEARDYYERHKKELKGTLPDLREKIKKLLFNEKFENIFTIWMKKLKEESVVQIFL